MNTLVLGGCGFIGSHLVDRLLAAGDRVRVMDRQPELYRAPLPGVEYHFGDFGNRADLHSTLTGQDTVFHLINTTVPATSNEDPTFDITSNVVETLHLLEQCVREGVKKVVFVSSGGAVYGTPTAVPVAEDAPTNPESSYGITKLTIEKYLALFHRLHGLDYAIVRPSNPFGPRQHLSGAQGVIAISMGRIAAGQPVEVWGDGEAVKDYIYVGDLVEGICRAASSPRSARLYNLGSGVGTSLNNLLQLIAEVADRPFDVIHTPRMAHDVPRIFLDVTRAGLELSWRPVTPLRTGLERTWAFVSSCAGPTNQIR